MTTVTQITPITIGNLPNATTITGNEAVPIVQGGATVQTPIASFVSGFSGATGTFTTTDSKVVTVTNGIITAIN